MVITNNDITQKTYKKLSIQVSLSGLSFCVFDLLSNKVINTMSIHFEKNKVIEEQLWRTFVDYPILTKSFDEVIQKVKEYADKFANPYGAAARGFIDAVIQPEDTRSRLIDAFQMLENKVCTLPRKKHGNIPL